MEDIAIIMEFMNAGTLQEHLEKADGKKKKEERLKPSSAYFPFCRMQLFHGRNA